MKTIVIRTLGGKGIGYGHYYRCLSLAKAIRLLDESISIIFVVNGELEGLTRKESFQTILAHKLEDDYKIVEELSPKLFIFDSYLGDSIYLKQIKSRTRLMLIDDNNDIYDTSIADILYNGNIHAEKLNYPKPDGQTQFIGSKYLIMKEEYWSSSKAVEIKEGMLITTGGSDEHEVALELLRTLKFNRTKIKIIIGPGYKDEYIKKLKKFKRKNIEFIYRPASLKSYIASSELVVTAGGSTIYEALSQNATPIVFSLADNQDLICKTLEGMRIPYIGKYPDIKYVKLKYYISNLKATKDSSIYTTELVNPCGAILVAAKLSDILSKENILLKS